jgi:tryptophanyl-tRNA synthetase
MRAVTDSGPTEPNQPKAQAIENLFNLMKVVSSTDTSEHFESLYNTCSIRYGDMKKQLAEDIIAFTTPLRLKINELSRDNAYLQKVVRRGAEKARESASATMREVRHIIGFREF